MCIRDSIKGLVSALGDGRKTIQDRSLEVLVNKKGLNNNHESDQRWMQTCFAHNLVGIYARKPAPKPLERGE